MTINTKRIMYLELFHFVSHSIDFKSALQDLFDNSSNTGLKRKIKYTFGNNGKFKSCQKNVTQVK